MEELKESEEYSIKKKETLSKLFFRFLKFGFLAWGGPVAQIAMIRQELVEEEKWISKEKFNRVLGLYQALPGPEATELSIYFGMLARGRIGGLIAGLAFVFPGFILMLLLSFLYVQIGIESPLVKAVFGGFQLAVVALIISAVHRIGKHAILNKYLFVIALVAAITQFTGLSFYIVLPACGLAYMLVMKRQYIISLGLGVLLLLVSFLNFSDNSFFNKEDQKDLLVVFNKPSQTPSLASIFWTGCKAGSLTFGGAYTAIPFIQEDAVYENNWISNNQFLDGIALAGILPAPLIIFSTFVGYIGAGILGAIVITIAIFLPAFAITLFGHDKMERIIEKKSVHNFLDGLTAGVIGLIGVTALQLVFNSLTDISAIAIFILCMVVLYTWKRKTTIIFVIMGSGVISLGLFYLK